MITLLRPGPESSGCENKAKRLSWKESHIIKDELIKYRALRKYVKSPINRSLYLSFFISIAVIDLSIWTQIIIEIKNGLWNLCLVWDPNENNDIPIL
jgi:hypothetical protein